MGRLRELLHDMVRQADLVLLALCSLATLYGMVLILSATHTVYNGSLKRVFVQGLGWMIGIAAYFFLSSLDVAELSKRWKWLFGFNVGFILLLLTPLGLTRNNNRAWLGIGDFPITVQPAEVVKITFILLLARQMVELRETRDLKRFTNVVQPTAHVLVMFVLY